MNLYFPEGIQVFNLLAPAADAAGRTSLYKSLKGAAQAWILVHLDQGNAATVLLTPLQASAVAGTGSKALSNVVPIYSNLDCAAASTMTSRTAAKNYTTDAGVKVKQVLFLIDAGALDVDGGFDCIAVSTGASNAANITEAQLIILPRYQQAAPINVLAD